MQRMQRYLLPFALLALVSATCIGFFSATKTTRAAQSIAGLHVSGNQLLNGSGQVIRLVGVDRSSAEYSCISGGTTNVFDDPNNLSYIPAMLSWGINAVRIPLNIERVFSLLKSQSSCHRFGAARTAVPERWQASPLQWGVSAFSFCEGYWGYTVEGQTSE